jgi:hypothetical protein
MVSNAAVIWRREVAMLKIAEPLWRPENTFRPDKTIKKCAAVFHHSLEADRDG